MVSYDTRDVVELRKNVGLLHGSFTPAKTVKTHGDWVIAWDTLVDATFLSSGIGNKSYSPMVNTFSDILCPYHPKSISRLSITTKLSKSGPLNNAILSSPMLQSLRTCKSNGSTVHQILPLASPRNQNLNRIRTADGALPAADGMRTGAQTQPPTATTFMCVPNVPMEGMLQAAVALPVRSKAPSCNVRWEHQPRFIHDYVWSDVKMLDVTTALVMETTPPVPEPPQNELVNIERWNTISSRPHLFCVTMLINIHCFREMLASHPNQPLVKSVCKGLCEGFWPWAVTDGLDAPSIVDNAVLQKLKDPSHLCFIEEQRDEEIRLGRFSEAFTMLSPGMTTIPLWVVPKPHSDKSHLVVDHSAGDYSLNSFISSDDAGIHLDTLHALGKALTCVRSRFGAGVPLVLFKTDVSQAYRRLPMHPLWQLHQIVAICGSHHVDNNNNFSNRGAGQLWITFFGLVLWVAVFVKFVCDLFTYVDDAFSWEFASEVSFYHPYKKFMPTKQACLLTLFDDLGVPHEERKQILGSPLQIIGFNVDPNTMTITMSCEA